MPGPNGANVAANNAPDDDVMANINDSIDIDSDMYEAEEPDDDGTDLADTDAGDSGDDTGDRNLSPDNAGPEEPEFPIELPRQPAPSQSQYDPDNPRGYTRVGSLFADAQGNIVTRDGRVMAAKGEPARHWVNMSKAAGQASALQRQNETLQRQIQQGQEIVAAAKELNELPTRLGVSREDYNTGVQLIHAWRRDPLTVCRDMVARTMAQGFNATDILGTEAGNAVEMGALRQLVNEATAGQRQREEMERNVATQRTNAQVAYDTFVGRYPDAVTHADAIAALMNQRNMGAEQAYHEIRYFALQEGLDFSQPLGPQLALKMQRQQRQPNVQTQRAPMVAGNGGGSRDHLTNSTVLADANASWGDILNDVMRASA